MDNTRPTRGEEPCDRPTSEQLEAHDLYERIRPVLEEYFDNWLICGHRAGGGTNVTLGHCSPTWGDMTKIRNEIRNWQAKSMEDSGKVLISTK